MTALVCPECGANIPQNSLYCNMCGVRLEDAKQLLQDKMRRGELPLYEKTIHTSFGEKKIKVVCADATQYKGTIDVLTISAAYRSYYPVNGTLIAALEDAYGICVEEMADKPLLDCRELGNCWISRSISGCGIHRIGCVERGSRAERNQRNYSDEESLLKSLTSYFHMLDLISDAGKSVETVAMPMLGAGSLGMDTNLLTYPMVNEAVNFLKRNQSVKQLIFMEINYDKAVMFKNCLEKSLQLSCEGSDEKRKSDEPYVFISYTTKGDSQVAELMSECFNKHGIANWFAPHELRTGDYAEKIVEAISKSTHFVCIVSSNSMQSEHVLNELDLAFQDVNKGMRILPFRLDEGELRPSFKYYLSRMQWSKGNPPPIENRIDEFIENVFMKPDKQQGE